MKLRANGAGARPFLALAWVLAATSMAVPVQADDTLDDTARRFGLRQTVLDISLSPSGSKVAFVSAGPEHAEVLNIIDLDGDATIRPVTYNTEKSADLQSCEWATESRLVCQVAGMGKSPDGTLIPYDRMFAINADGSQLQRLSERDSYRATRVNQFGGDLVALDRGDSEGEVLITRNFVPEIGLATRMARNKSGLGVEVVDMASGRSRTLEPADDNAVRYVADEDGRVRIKVRALTDGDGNLSGDYVYLYRTPDSETWNAFENLSIGDAKVGAFTPVAVDSAKNVAYGFTTRDGYDAVIEVAMDGSNTGRVVMARDDVDVDSLIRIGRERRVVGASYATEKRQVAYFDPELAKLADGLAKALPDKPLINILGASADEQILLLIASSDTQPGMVYLFNKGTKNLEPLMPVRDYLDNQAMGQMKPVSYPARDGTQIPAYLTLPPGSDGKNLPAIVMPHGGPAARDEWGFDWLVQFLTARGYAVLQPNYRGSSGYGEAWYGRNGFKAWDVAIGDVNDAGCWLVSEGIAKADQLAIAGWSYGGYAALQSQVLDPDLFKAVVAVAPVTDLGYLSEDARSYTTSRLVRDFIGEGPHIAAGSPRRHADRFAAPVALYHGTLDLNVDVRHARAMEKALKDSGKSVVYREYEDLQHSLSDSTARADMLNSIGQFLDSSLGRE